MPYSWNRPPVPIDKSKQGGRNFDSSTYLDLVKIGTIAQVNATKTAGTNNKNLYTDANEQRRTKLLISGLQTIPRALCSTCPVVNGVLVSNCSSGIIFSGNTTFWIMYGNGTGTSPSTQYTYTYSNFSITPTHLNFTFSGNSGYTKILVNISSALSGAINRNDILAAINSVLTANTGVGKTITSPLTASFTSDGRLILTTPSNIPSGYLFGLYFGTANQPDGNTGNGSTDLGVTNQVNTPPGVDYAALLITGGTNSVTARYAITC